MTTLLWEHDGQVRTMSDVIRQCRVCRIYRLFCYNKVVL